MFLLKPKSWQWPAGAAKFVTLSPRVLAAISLVSLEPSAPADDNAHFPCARSLHTLQATKKQDKEPDKFPSSCRYRIEESRG
jgi:hypothetical protein